MDFDQLKLGDTRCIKFENSVWTSNVMGRQHYHDVFEIYFLEYGSCHYFIDDKSYDVQAGDIVLIPQGTIHKTMYDSGSHKRSLIFCSMHFIPTSLIELLPSIMYHYRNPEISDQIRDIIKSIEKEFSTMDEFSTDAILNHLHLLFFLLARNRSSTIPSHTNKTYITQTISYVKENYSQQLRLSDIAKMHSVSAEHLSREFKKETGFGFNEYLTMLRLQNAERLLKDGTKRSIAEIAYDCGFNDSNYFSDKFKRIYGVSPIKFKNK